MVTPASPLVWAAAGRGASAATPEGDGYGRHATDPPRNTGALRRARGRGGAVLGDPHQSRHAGRMPPP